LSYSGLRGADGGDGSQECFVRHSHPGWLVRSPTLSEHVTYFSQQDNCVYVPWFHVSVIVPMQATVPKEETWD